MIVKWIIAVGLVSVLCEPTQLPANYTDEPGTASINFSCENTIVLQAEIRNQRLEKRPREGFYRLVLPTKLSLINNQKESLLLIRDAIQIVGVRIATTESNLTKSIYIHDSSSFPSFKNESLKASTLLTSDAVDVLFQNGRYDWVENYWISLKEESSESPFSRSLTLNDLRAPEADRSSVWIEFDIAFFPMNSMRTEGEKLKSNWKDRGTLLLETLTTLPIEISIPKTVTLDKEDN